MRRKNREINIFSMSALDLFASAMGAFILIAVVALPYYLKTDHSLMAELRQALEQLAQAEQQLQQTQQQLAKSEAEKQQLQESLEQAQEELDNAIQFALLGISTKATSFTILIDMSGSMDQYTALMERTVGRLIEPMDDKNSVQVIGFQGDSDLINWQSPYQTRNMSDSNKRQLARFVSGLSAQFGGGTPTQTALLEALNYDTDAVILLTDGAPTDNSADDIVMAVTRANGNVKEIHSVAVGDYDNNPELVRFLQKLATQNRGGFLGVSR